MKTAISRALYNSVWIAITCWSIIYCPYLHAQRGLYGFLRNDASARAAALAGSFIAVQNDPVTLFYNPAGIASTEDNQLSITFFKHVADINSGFVAYTTSLQALGVKSNAPIAQGSIAAGVNYVHYGTFQRVDRNGSSLSSSFGGGNIAYTIGYANELDSQWFYGVAIKYINTYLDNAATGAFAVDVGMLYRIPKSNVNIALCVLNAGGQVTPIHGTHEPLPLDVRLGVNHRLRGLPLLLNLTFTRLADEVPTFTDRFLNFALGGEFYVGSALRVRIGYDNQRRREIAADTQPRLAGFSGGVGITLNTITIDYALSLLGIPGDVHRLSLNVHF
ncbi:MAG: PorV/PorQ family protein [Bacteroidota bacterium]|nr:PorV/PorQ family protein [Candidatus Kapabacteria bacterium]MDW8220772.1 PorV/PorQ family protein [Bacteroidota bacterium]